MENMNDLIKVMSPESGILQIHLNRPKQLNALSHDVLKTLSQILEQAKNDKSVKAILLTGEGKGFCAGADIKELAGLNGASGLEFARFGQAVMTQLLPQSRVLHLAVDVSLQWLPRSESQRKVQCSDNQKSSWELFLVLAALKDYLV